MTRTTPCRHSMVLRYRHSAPGAAANVGNGMRGWAYYNEWDADAAAWLRELIADGLLPDGEVDTRSIADVRPDDLAGFRQCHFFAGIGGWPFALRLAGWPDDRPVWTGSPPCQPFSAAGQQRGVNDERHLAPVWAELVAACRPPRIYGEQVASAAVLGRAGNKDMHPLWQRARSLQFLKDSIDRELAQRLSELPQRGRASSTHGEARDDAAQSDLDGVERTIPGRETESPVRSDCGLHTGETGRRNLRGHGDTVLHGIEAGMGIAFDGQDHAIGGLYQIECEDGSLFCEHGFLRLGAGARENGRARDLADARRKVERAIEANTREIEASTSYAWIDDLQLRLERAGYACGAADLPAAGIGAPHIRQRTWFVAQRLADADKQGSCGRGIQRPRQGDGESVGAPLERSEGLCADGAVADADGGHASAERQQRGGQHGQQPQDGGTGVRPDAHHSGWANPDWLLCRDGKLRPVESSLQRVAPRVSESLVPGSYPLAQGQEARTKRLRGYGNAIVPQIAAQWIVLTDAEIGTADAAYLDHIGRGRA